MLHFMWLFWASTIVLAKQDAPTMREPKREPRTHWPHVGQKYRQEDYRDGVSHGYIPLTYNTENASEYPTYSHEYWRPALSNYTATSYGYSKPYIPTSAGATYQDSIRGSPSTYQYQQVRPKGTYTMKKVPTYYKEKYPTQLLDTLGKPKYKKQVLYQSPTTFKKLVYPRVHKPHVKNKYPTQKTVHPIYRRYYQSPYQQYAIPSNDLRYHSGYYKSSTLPTPASDRYYTTERMDDQDGLPTGEEYSNYNDTYSKFGGSYYENYEEVEKTTAEPDESSYDETTTRGYYGDRIYMSTQTPVPTSDKITVKNKYYVIKRTSSDDDIETIFE